MHNWLVWIITVRHEWCQNHFLKLFSPIISESGTAESNNNCIAISLTPEHNSDVKRRRDAVVSANGRTASVLSDNDDVFSPAATETGMESTETTTVEDDAESPTVRDFTKKNDSVSYVLDLGGEHSPSVCGGIPPLSAPYALLTPGSPWTSRRSSGLVRSASLRYPHRPYNAHHWWWWWWRKHSKRLFQSTGWGGKKVNKSDWDPNSIIIKNRILFLFFFCFFCLVFTSVVMPFDFKF